MPRRSSRRDFLKHSTLAAAAWWVAPRPALSESKSPNEKLNLGIIGPGGQGGYNLSNVETENIVAICDVDERRGGAAFEKHPMAKRFADFRKLLDDMGDRIDAAVVSTPDHIHVPAAVRAMRMGKHVYCEKPLSHSVWESRLAAKTAAEHKVATQLGTQIHAGDNYRRVVEVIQSGAIGPVGEVHVWVGKGWGGGERPTETPPVPETLAWDLWLGPAPERPYHPTYLPANWRRWWDFGNGTLGDMGCHYMDLPFWALKLRHPTTIEAQGPQAHPETAPLGMSVRYEFPQRDDMPAATLTWYDGDMCPKPGGGSSLTERNPASLLKLHGQPVPGSGVLFVGEKGLMLADYNQYKLLPEDQFAGYRPPESTIPRSIGHHQEWIRACKTGEPTTCNFDYSGALSESVLLGTVALRTGKKLEWDAETLTATNCPEAAPLLRRDYRAGWEL